jgi:ribosomal protein S20
VYVSAAQESLEVNDTETAVSMLSMAVNTLKEALDKISSLDLPKHLKEMAEKARGHMERTDKRTHMKEREVFEKVSKNIDRIMEGLRKLKEAADRGMVDKEKVAKEFSKALEHLEKLREALKEKAPEELLHKIDDAIEWIRANMPR